MERCFGSRIQGLGKPPDEDISSHPSKVPMDVLEILSHPRGIMSGTENHFKKLIEA